MTAPQAPAPPPGQGPGRHDVRDHAGKFTPAAASPHHKVVRSAYGGAQLGHAPGFTPYQEAGTTAQAAAPGMAGSC